MCLLSLYLSDNIPLFAISTLYFKYPCFAMFILHPEGSCLCYDLQSYEIFSQTQYPHANFYAEFTFYVIFYADFTFYVIFYTSVHYKLCHCVAIH